MATRRLSGMTTSSSVPDNGGDHSGGGGSAGFVDDVFSAYVYEGRNSSFRLRNGIDLYNEGGLVWIKSRSGTKSHQLVDTERGQSKYLSSETKNGEIIDADGRVRYFNNDGFSLGTNNEVNGSGEDYASWTFRKSPSFFDCVTYTGDGGPDLRSIPHNLGITPGMIITKNIKDSSDWFVWHRGLTALTALKLNLNRPPETQGALPSPPTDQEFFVQDSLNNEKNKEYVAYVFAHDDSDEGIIQCGTYKGALNNKIDLGWEPQWLLIKQAQSPQQENWIILDSMRGIVKDGADSALFPNLAEAERSGANGSAQSTEWVNLTATGFELPDTHGEVNTTRQDYIYMAIRRPNKRASDFEPEELFNLYSATVSGNNTNPVYRTSPEWPVDFSFFRDSPTIPGNLNVASRLAAPNYQRTNLNELEQTLTESYWDYMNGWRSTGGNDQSAWMWRRAPGFFDVVTYDGDGLSPQTIQHGLGVKPEMMWIKSREQNYSWVVYSSTLGADRYLRLNGVNSQMIKPEIFRDTEPTDEVFTVGDDNSVNKAVFGYIAYLWASVPGICDIGTYTGGDYSHDSSTNSVRVDCGFTNGPRFVLIKRFDETSDWMYWDSLRGLGFSGNPMLKMFSTDAQVANDYIQAEPFGFRAREGHPTNIDGAQYIYMAIA